jgi:hypothetical protein
MDPSKHAYSPGMVMRESGHQRRSERVDERLGVYYTPRKIGE